MIESSECGPAAVKNTMAGKVRSAELKKLPDHSRIVCQPAKGLRKCKNYWKKEPNGVCWLAFARLLVGSFFAEVGLPVEG
jgi:hypothetical protein